MTKYPYAKQSISEADCQAVRDALTGARVTRGEKTALFEEKLAKQVDASWAVSFSSGTAALHAAYFAANLTQWDKILAPAITFVGSINYAAEKSASIEFIDIEKESGNMDIALVKEQLELPLSRGRYIIVPVHYAGIALDMRALDSYIKTPNVVVIEDAAHAIGSYYPSGEKVGSCTYSAMTIFSFHPAKTITTGEGGAVTTNDEKLYKRLKLFRDNGIIREGHELSHPKELGYYEVHALSGNYHMTEMQAALGISQLERIDSFIEKRRALVARYRKNFQEHPVFQLYSDLYDARTAYHLMTVKIDFEKHGKERTRMMRELLEAGIGTEVHYVPLYHHPVLKSRWKKPLPQTELHYERALSLPLYYDLQESDVDTITEALKAYFIRK